mgnify:FL=1|jgi:hypothetical protein
MSKVNQFYNMIQGDAGSPLSCTVIYSGIKGTHIFTGFLQEDPKIANQSTYNNSMPGFGGMLGKGMDLVTKGANMASSVLTNSDGGGQVVNPLQTRNLWQGNEFNSFDVTVTMYTLNEDTDVLQKAQTALALTSPTFNGNILEAPGGYLYGFTETFDRGHAQNTWAIRMGNHFTATHLACTGVRITVSKETVRLGDPRNYNNLDQPTAPLYVQLNFSFITDRLRYSDETPTYITQRQAGLSVVGNPDQATKSIAGIFNNNGKGKSWIGSVVDSTVDTAKNAVSGVVDTTKNVATEIAKTFTGGSNGNV